MATTSNLNSIFESFPALIKLPNLQNSPRRATRVACLLTKNHQPTHLHATRRALVGLASFTLLANSGTGPTLAENNGFWIDGPIPVPYANNKIDNEETGTRSFLKKGIYIANIGFKGRMQRLRRYAFDLLAMADLIAQEDAWNYVRRYLRLKSTFMYYDFDQVISAAPTDDKESLTGLANRLFDSFERLLDAVRKQDVPQIYSCYEATTPLLEEVMTRMA